MQRAQTYLMALVLLTLFLSGCSVLEGPDKPEINLKDFFPNDLEVSRVQRIDVTGDDEKEWLVFYHIDLVENKKKESPIAAAIYRPVTSEDKRMPPQLVTDLLWLPGQGYLCLYFCKAEMKDVIDDVEGKELVIRDEREGEKKDELVGVAIFGWNNDLVVGRSTEPGGFVPLGYFRGDLIEIKPNRVTVIHQRNDRSNLAAKETYTPKFGRYYKKQAEDVFDANSELFMPEEAEVIMWPGPPEKPAEVKMPEKLVMAFYLYYDNPSETDKFTSATAKDKIAGGCPADTCGCASNWRDVSQVMVKQIAYETEDKQDFVVAQVLCIRKNGQTDPVKTVTWHVEQLSDGTWRLIDVFPGGDEYIISLTTSQ